MARIEVTTHIEASPSRVWDVLVDWERQREWMADLRDVRVTSAAREGVGVTLTVRSDILGLAVPDRMRVTTWAPQRELGVAHEGPVFHAVGSFELEETSDGTHLTWWDEASVPGGELTDALASRLVSPLLRRTFRRSLATLKRVCEQR